jgi:glycosyltransferase involved in cell wall biosynthesis
VGKERGFITGDDEVHVRASKLKSRVLFAGAVDDRTLLKYYNNAALFVFPSLYEGFGLPPLEAMACGCPVVSSYTSSLREVCGDAAYYVDQYDINSISKGMLTVLTDKSLRETLRTKGYERARDLTWEKSALKHAELLKDALFA